MQKGIYDEFLKKLVERAEKIKIGAPMDSESEMGPISNFKQLEIIEKNIKLTVEQGGKINVVVKDIHFQMKAIIFLQQLLSAITIIYQQQKMNYLVQFYL